jgi:PKD repeat protein
LSGYETLVSNLTVDADGTDHAGVRWFELRKTGDAWAIHQQGTYAPDSDHRWMGSIAMDKMGNIALGYSVSSSSVYPSVRYAGRLAGDPLNTLPQAEVEMAAGTTYHNGGNRWGDYSMMAVDPVDDCTFWYTQEYIASPATAWGNWDTRIGSFQFPGCTGATGTLSGTVKEVGTGSPITGARVEAKTNPTFVTYSGAPDGDYRFAAIPVSVYTVTAEAYGYLPQTFTGVDVFSGTTTIQDLNLTPASLYLVEGAVTDAATGWPLYARVEIAGYPGGTIWNDLVTGYYSVTLAEGLTYTFHVEAWVDGYLPASRAVGPLAGNETQDLVLDADLAACTAPGYKHVTLCAPQPGGLVVGHVYDDNTGDPLTGAQVANEDGFLATAEATPDDARVDDGFYTIFSPPGSRPFTATQRGYAPDVDAVTVVQSDTVRHDFNLAAGNLTYDPASLKVTLDMGMSTTLPFTLTNDGGWAAEFEFIELDKGMSPLGPFEKPNYGVKPFKQHYLTTERLTIPDPPSAPPYAAGDIIQTWPTNLTFAWGLGYNTDATDLWLGNIATGGGDDLDYRFLTDDTNTGDTIDISWAGYWAADMTYNLYTDMLWQADVGGDDCIHELDPVSLVHTGDTLCPDFAASQRGLAYDPSTDTYLSGSWYDLMIHHFAADGTMLDQVNVGLAIAGLAYNPDTEHLFVMVNDTPNPVYVLDAADNYNLTGQFTIAGFTDYGGAGLEMDCDGNLWAVDQNTQTVYQLESGESTTMCASNVPWLSQDPITGTVASMTSQVIDVTFDAGKVDQPGLYHAQLKIEHDTPYNVTKVPVTMTVVHAPVCGFISSSPDDLGQTTYFTNTTTGATPLTYRWDFGDGSTLLTTGDSAISTAEHPTHTYAHAGFYTVVLTTTNVYGEDVCTGTVEIFESFYGVMLAPSTDTTSGTPGATVTYTLQVTNTGNTVDTLTMTMSGNDWTTEVVTTVGPLASGESADVAVVVHIPAGANEGDSDTVTIAATSQGNPAESDGSVLTTTAAGACVSVSGADFTFAPAALIGQTFIFTGAVTAGTPPITYTWDLSDGSAAQVGNPITHDFPLTVTAQTCTVTMTATNGCPSQDTASRAVTVYLRYLLFPIMRNYGP